MKKDNHIRGMAYFKNNELVYFEPFNDIQKDKEIERLQAMDKILRSKNINLKLRIIKAIEYIESYMPNYDFDKTNLIKLLEILRGENNENNSTSK